MFGDKWRLFYASMLLMGVFAVLKTEGTKDPLNSDQDVETMGVSIESAPSIPIRVFRGDVPVAFTAVHDAPAHEVAILATERPHSAAWPSPRICNIDSENLNLAALPAKGFHLLEFQGTFNPAALL